MLNLADYCSDYLPTADDLIAFISGVKTGRVAFRHRVNLVTPDLVPIELPNPPVPSDPSLISPFVTALTVETNTTRDVVRSASIEVAQVPGLDWDTLHQLLRISMEYCDLEVQGGRQVWVPRVTLPWGYLLMTIPDRDINPGIDIQKVACDGLTYDAKDSQYENPLVVPANGSLTYTGAVRAMIQMDGLHPDEGGRSWSGTWPDPSRSGVAPSGCLAPGPNVPPARVSIPDTFPTVAVPTPFQRTDKWLASYNSLLKLGLSEPLFDDEFGVWSSRPIPAYQSSIPETFWTFTSDPQSSTLDGPISQRISDQTQLVNSITVVSSNRTAIAQGAPPIVVTYDNLSADSGISIPNWRKRRSRTISEDRIIDVAHARQLAFFAAQQSASLNETVQFTTSPVPLPIHAFVGLFVTKRNGRLEMSTEAYPFHVTSTSLDFVARTMTVTAERAVLV